MVIPVYNGGAMVAQALESVLKQSYPAAEVIVVDDGSTDDTPRVLASYGDRIIVRRIQNSGPSAARNEGIRTATGDWIAFLDHDDLWFRDKLRTAVALITRYPDAGFFCSNYITRYAHLKCRLVRHFDILRTRRKLNFDAPLKRHPFGLLLEEHFVGTPSAVMIRKDIIDKAGYFNVHNLKAQDYEYWLLCAKAATFLVSNEPLFYKRLHRTNLSGDQTGTLEDHLEVLRRMLARERVFVRRGHFERLARQAIVQELFRVGNAYFESGRPAEAFSSYAKAFAEWPSLPSFLQYLTNAVKKGTRLLLKIRPSITSFAPVRGERRLTVSVIIATMNRSADLRAALASIARQTHLPRQVLIVDQSTDKLTRDLTESFRREHGGRIQDIRYVYQDEKSLVKARNRGIAHAEADILSFLDDDVVLNDDYYERVARYFERHPSVGALAGNDIVDHSNFSGWRWELRRLLQRFFLISHFDGKMTASGFGYPVFERSIDRVIPVEMLPGCDMSFRSELFTERKFDEWFTGYSYREDADLSYAVSLVCPVVMIPDAKLCHNQSPSNRLTPVQSKIMEIKNCRHVFKKFKRRGLRSELLFAYSMLGLVFIDLLEFIMSFKQVKLQKFLTSASASWTVLVSGD